MTAVAAQLGELGVATEAVAGCPAVHARVEGDLTLGTIFITVGDLARGFEYRTVSDPGVAAAWIASWLADEPEPERAPIVVIDPRPSSPGRSAEVPVHSHAVSLSAGYALTWLSDGNQAQGIELGAGAHGARWAAGCRFRWSPAAEIPGGGTGTAAMRSDVEVLAVASGSIQLGNMSLAPELGLGLGRTRTRRIDGCLTLPCDEDACVVAPPCNGQYLQTYYVHDGFVATQITPRLASRITVSLPLFAHVWFDVAGSATLAPGGHGAPYATLPTVPRGVAQRVDMPGEPGGAMQLAIALRVSGL